MTELKPCPFCGSDNTHIGFSNSVNIAYVGKDGLIHDTPFLYTAFCNECGAKTMFFLEREMAADAWNRRADE